MNPSPDQRVPSAAATRGAQRVFTHDSAPAVARGSMAARPWRGFTRSMAQVLLGRTAAAEPGAAPRSPEAWELAAARRRRVLLWLVGLSAVGSATLLTHALPLADNLGLRVGQVALSTLLFAWISAGFFTAVMGFYVQIRGDRHALSLADVAHRTLGPAARTAVIMPICNEHVPTVFAGLRATAESLAATGAARLFDFFVLSDSGDPEVRAAEHAAWVELSGRLGPNVRIHYRWRARRTRRKAGNVADFCRRWGKNYRYMVVLDADSVMSGDCLTTLVRLMEAHPTAGIIQTAPQACGLSTLHARAQQFAGRVTGRLFTTGMQFWQLGESHYWGHNAILRVAPFMEHAALAPLPGKGGLSGDILSHDFVEAALMRRAGYHVWLAPDLEGSYEQQPPNLLEEFGRDRRWCQGNLQNARLIAEPGLHGVHRAMLFAGAMSYLSAPLWMGFVLMGTALWLSGGYALFGAQLKPAAMVGLWSCTIAMLILPRVMALAAVVMRGEQQAFGGVPTLVKGAVLEAVLSVLQAPLRMVAHTLFVLGALTGLKLAWKSPPREASAIPWSQAARRFGPVSLVAAVLLGATTLVDPTAAVWLAPVGLPLLFAIPLMVLTSQVRFGERLQARRWLATPEELRTPTVLQDAWAHAQAGAEPEPQRIAVRAGGVRDLAWSVSRHGAPVVAANSTFGEQDEPLRAHG